jgi:hypothetical protein
MVMFARATWWLLLGINNDGGEQLREPQGRIRAESEIHA